MPFEVTILGSSSATPTSTRHPSAQVVNILGRFFLIDCGEGTQMQLRKYKFKLQKIKFICISHLHGDHYLGLIGLISTMTLLNRKSELLIFAPNGIEEIIKLHLKLSHSIINFPLKVISLKKTGLTKIFEDKSINLFSFPLKHRVPCWGFKLVEKKRKKNIIKSAIKKFNIPINQFNSIKCGSDFVDEKNNIIKNDMITIDSPEPRSYAYCSDTVYYEKIIDYVRDVDLLYHEATFHSDLQKRAKQTYHSTTRDAAKIAKKASVDKLIIGHFSSRYKDLDILKEDALKFFRNTDLALEGSKWNINKKNKNENNS